MKKNRFPFIVAVHAFFIKDGKVLLCERANTGYMDGYYSVPAGHVDGQETIWHAMQREILEEVGVQMREELEPAHVMHRMKKDEERIDFFYVIRKWDGDVKNTEPEKCAEIEWFELEKLPKENIIPYVHFALKNVLKKIMFSEYEE